MHPGKPKSGPLGHSLGLPVPAVGTLPLAAWLEPSHCNFDLPAGCRSVCTQLRAVCAGHVPAMRAAAAAADTSAAVEQCGPVSEPSNVLAVLVVAATLPEAVDTSLLGSLEQTFSQLPEVRCGFLTLGVHCCRSLGSVEVSLEQVACCDVMSCRTLTNCSSTSLNSACCLALKPFMRALRLRWLVAAWQLWQQIRRNNCRSTATPRVNIW